MTMLLLVTHANRTLGIDDRWFSLGDSLVLTVMGQVGGEEEKKAEPALGVACHKKRKAVGSQIDFWVIA